MALEHFERMPDGRIAYRMKRPLPGGRMHLHLTGLDLLRKLTPLVPPPRSNLVRFHGVFAPGAKLRKALRLGSRADRIAVLHDGRLLELGSHAQRMAQDGRYAHLFRLQARGYLD